MRRSISTPSLSYRCGFVNVRVFGLPRAGFSAALCGDIDPGAGADDTGRDGGSSEVDGFVDLCDKRSAG